MPTRQKPQSLPRSTRKAINPAAKPVPGIPEPATRIATATPPHRAHGAAYHWPLLLLKHHGESTITSQDADRISSSASCTALLRWFAGVQLDRKMPWRKPFLDPKGTTSTSTITAAGSSSESNTSSKTSSSSSNTQDAIARRAYEVWVSEVMLQQTRVSTVIPYFETWIAKWPTVRHLAGAEEGEVLAVWKGLGYYSRATRLQQGAKELVRRSEDGDEEAAEKICVVPDSVEELIKVSGIGRYTAGAVASIAFGRPEPVVDGNVSRVLSRQLGLYVDVKEKKTSELLWDVAGKLVRHVSGYGVEKVDGEEDRRSAVPGQWNQALMELGSTICTPAPKCGECPIQGTCRAFAEGEILVRRKKMDTSVTDIEDMCSLCEQIDTEDLVLAPEIEEEDMEEEVVKTVKRRKTEKGSTKSISSYFTSNKRETQSSTPIDDTDKSPESSDSTNKRKASSSTQTGTSKLVSSYCALFPKKAPKKKVAEEECVVCLIELPIPNGGSKWLIEQRPAKGLLASLWQFPQHTLASANSTPSKRVAAAQKYISTLFPPSKLPCQPRYVGELGRLVHVFTHLKLTMHVHHFRLDTDTGVDCPAVDAGLPARKWVGTEDMENETLSTGMRRCWALT